MFEAVSLHYLQHDEYQKAERYIKVCADLNPIEIANQLHKNLYIKKYSNHFSNIIPIQIQNATNASPNQTSTLAVEKEQNTTQITSFVKSLVNSWMNKFSNQNNNNSQGQKPAGSIKYKLEKQ